MEISKNPCHMCHYTVKKKIPKRNHDIAENTITDIERNYVSVKKILLFKYLFCVYLDAFLLSSCNLPLFFH